MNQKSKALACADELEKVIDFQSRAWDAARELRRLHGVNAELLMALQTILDMALMGRDHWAKTIEVEAHAAIAKATGETK